MEIDNGFLYSFFAYYVYVIIFFGLMTIVLNFLKKTFFRRKI